MSKEKYKLTEGVPVAHVERLLNDIMPKKYPDYKLVQVITAPHMIPGSNLQLPKAPPQMVQLAFAILEKKST